MLRMIQYRKPDGTADSTVIDDHELKYTREQIKDQGGRIVSEETVVYNREEYPTVTKRKHA